MPARLALTPEEHLARIREQARRRVQRYRERRNATGSVTEPSLGGGADAGHVTPSQTLPVLTPSLREGEEVLAVLEPFADRGYQHDPKWWRRLAQLCPDVDLYLEASNIAEWLLEPVNRKEACSKRRIGRWLKKAQADIEAGKARPAPSSAVSPKGVVVNGTYHPPASMQKNPGPATPPLLLGELVRDAPGDWERFQRERAGIPFKDKVAAKNGRPG